MLFGVLGAPSRASGGPIGRGLHPSAAARWWQGFAAVMTVRIQMCPHVWWQWGASSSISSECEDLRPQHTQELLITRGSGFDMPPDFAKSEGSWLLAS